MKKLIFAMLLLPTIAFSQNESELAAVPSKNMDTLYVQHGMYSIFKEVWEIATDEIKPVIVSVEFTRLYALKEDL